MTQLDEKFKKILGAEMPAEEGEIVLDYLISRNIIGKKTIQRFTILKEFDELLPENNFHRTQTVLSLANKYNISERTIWTILKTHARRFDVV